jgi:peptide/nickel transport system substrate-binding protein
MSDATEFSKLDELTRQLQEGNLTRRSLLKRATVLGLSVPAIAGLLAACGDDDDDDDDAPAPTAPPAADPTPVPDDDDDTDEPEPDDDDDDAAMGDHPQGGEIIIGTLGEAQTINPFLTNETEGTWRCKMMFDEFVTLHPVTYEPIPSLAAQWEISDDATSYTFTLQDEILFSDGSQMTMNDIAFHFHGILRPESTSPFVPQFIDIDGAAEYNAGDADSISGIEVQDDHTLTLTMAEPNAGFLVNLRNIRPVPSALLEGADLANDDFFQNPVGAGPFKFVSWNIGGDFVAERNENYWQPGKPYLDRFIHRTIADSQTLVLSLETGEIDGSNYPAPTVAGNLETIDDLVVMVPPFTQPDGWSFNQAHEQLAIKEVRQAIAMSLNMQQYVDDFLLGLGEVGIGPIAPGNWAFNQNLEPVPYDLDRARELMAEAGYPDGGFSVQFTTNAGNVMREDFFTFTQAALAEIGITAEANVTEWSQVVQSASDGTFEALCPTWSGANIEPDELYLTLHSQSARNVYGYENAEVDQLLEEARESTSQDERKEKYDRIQEILMDDMPIFWAWYRPFVHVTKTRYAGYEDSSLTGGLFVQLENWYVDE